MASGHCEPRNQAEHMAAPSQPMILLANQEPSTHLALFVKRRLGPAMSEVGRTPEVTVRRSNRRAGPRPDMAEQLNRRARLSLKGESRPTQTCGVTEPLNWTVNGPLSASTATARRPVHPLGGVTSWDSSKDQCCTASTRIAPLKMIRQTAQPERSLW